MILDWLVYVLGVVAVVFLVGMFFKYKKCELSNRIEKINSEKLS